MLVIPWTILVAPCIYVGLVVWAISSWIYWRKGFRAGFNMSDHAIKQAVKGYLREYNRVKIDL